ncbi:BA5345 family protein [Bacillus mojavensis]|uniref:hypothetical protein n=1 Tax=Bacillus mojavensis TaxID=72360 RepID=UPI002DBCCBB9|nr:hypothetical protein [Bacillus mojavensis]MEC1669819.1 hypothetical protein [Bacillus mojavensis]
MNSEFQIVRWGIPGWLFFVTFLLFKLTVTDFNIIKLMNSFTNPAAVAGIAAFFVALGVPLGYVFYQVYFALKWRVIKNKTIFVSAKGIPELENSLGDKSNLELWNAIEAHFDHLMTVVSNKKDLSYKDLVRRSAYFNNRTSRIHGLGASALSMSMGFVFFFCTTPSRAALLDNNYFIVTLVFFSIGFWSVAYNYYIQNKNSFLQFNYLMRDIIEADERMDDKKEDSDEE